MTGSLQSHLQLQEKKHTHKNRSNEEESLIYLYTAQEINVYRPMLQSDQTLVTTQNPIKRTIFLPLVTSLA